MSTNTKSYKSILGFTKNPRFSFPSFPCPGREPSENTGSFTEGGGEWPPMARTRQKPHVREHVLYTEPYVLGHRVSRIGQLLLPKSTRSGCPASTRTFMKAACRQRGGQGRRQDPEAACRGRGGQGRRQDLPQQHRGLGPTLAVHTQGHASTSALHHVPSRACWCHHGGPGTFLLYFFFQLAALCQQPALPSTSLHTSSGKSQLHLKRSRLPWLGQALHILLLRGSTFLPFFFSF